MSRLFISHSTNDKAEVEQLIDFLVLGMGVARSDIFCTSQNRHVFRRESTLWKKSKRS